MPTIKHDPAKPWLLILEFPTHADAKAAQDLLADLLPTSAKLRPKQQRPTAANIGQWQFTKIARGAFGSRSFDKEAVQNLMLEHNYVGREPNAINWLSTARCYGVVEYLGKGQGYRFPAIIPSNHLEPSPCEAR